MRDFVYIHGNVICGFCVQSEQKRVNHNESQIELLAYDFHYVEMVRNIIFSWL